MICGSMLLLGLLVLGLYLRQLRYGTTPEAELTLARGTPILERLSKSGDGDLYLKFSVAGYRTEYSSRDPNFEEVLDLVQKARPLRVWVSTKGETLFERDGWVPLYKLAEGDRMVVEYESVVARKSAASLLVVALILLAIGGWGVFLCARNLRRARSGGYPEALRASWRLTTRQRITVITVIIALALYAALVRMQLSPDVHEINVAAWGSEPFGVPVRVVVIVAGTLLFLPFPFAFYHAVLLTLGLGKQGSSLTLSSILLSHRLSPELRRSQRICQATFLYFVILAGGWILSTSWLGI
jgi:hypothetical protein